MKLNHFKIRRIAIFAAFPILLGFIIGMGNEKANCSPVPGPPVTSIYFWLGDEVSDVSYKVYGTPPEGGWYWDPGTWTADNQQAQWLSRYYYSMEVYYRYYNGYSGTYCYGSQSFTASPYIIYRIVYIDAPPPME
jgi:hypothetical protein